MTEEEDIEVDRSDIPQSCDPTVEIYVPSTLHITRHTAKWKQVLPENEHKNIDKEDKGTTDTPFLRHQPCRVKIYYRKMKKDERVLKEAKRILKINSMEEEDEEGTNKNKRCHRCIKCHCIELSVDTAARLTLAINFLLFFMKLAAAIQSGSLSIISSLIDSTLDLFSGAVIAITSYLIRHYDPYHYPIGRTRLEPVAIIITAAIMGTAALQIITTSIEDIITDSANPNINAFSATIIVLTVILKGTLFVLCYQVDNPSVRTLATDHRNDVASNIAALIFGLLGTYVINILDPIGALLLAFYIVFNWILVGREQLINLVGHRADRRLISKIIFITMEHSEKILKVDTVRAYTFGVNYLVEVHIVLNPDMVLEESHDIGESLQLTLESMKEVERAFVHCDFETEHSPSTEHILPSPD